MKIKEYNINVPQSLDIDIAVVLIILNPSKQY